MIRTLIVDDDALVHVTLRSLINWEAYGYSVVGDCVGGNQALSFLKDHTVDLLITDMKMPGMGGLELMQNLRRQSHMPVTVALSGYDEFELVREAFRLGAYDYLLKSDLNQVGLERLLTGLRQRVFRDFHVQSPAPEAQKPEKLEPGLYMVASFRVQHFTEAARRFGDNLRERMEKPMLELVHQIHRLQGRAVFQAKDPSYYEMYYQVRDKGKARDTVVSIAQQIQGVWRDFMNLEAAVGISDVVADAQIPEACRTCEILGRLSILQGVGKVCAQWQYGALAQLYAGEGPGSDGLIAALCGEDREAMERETGLWFSGLKGLPDKAHSQRILVLMARLGARLHDYGQSYFRIFPEEPDVAEILKAFDTPKEREIWLRNTLRRVVDACDDSRKKKQLSAMERAREFMQDNFMNPELTLRTVADLVGFNEKYFSNRFTREFGCTFIGYLNDLRIHRAKELLLQTDMKMYEISEAVGYSSVEHFNHMFKKKIVHFSQRIPSRTGKSLTKHQEIQRYFMEKVPSRLI